MMLELNVRPCTPVRHAFCDMNVSQWKIVLSADPIINYLPCRVFMRMRYTENVPPTDMLVMQSPTGSDTLLHLPLSNETAVPSIFFYSVRLYPKTSSKFSSGSPDACWQ